MRKARKSLAILLAVAMVFCMAPAMVFGAGDDGQVNRIAGNDRYITSAETALRAFESADTVLIARGDDEGGFADGLAASYLAGVENAPILLTEPNGLPPVVKDAISKLGAKKAIILGGPAVVSDKVKDDLAGLEVERIFGDDRFETAAKIAAKGKADTAFVVSGYAPADSLVAGPLAFSKNYPILLVGNNVPDFTSKALADLGIKNIYVIGGTGVVSESVYNDLAAKADQIVRYGGNDRVATSLEVAQNLYTNPVNFSIVGYDGLADAVGAAVFGNPILYTDSDLGISGIQSYLAGAVTADSNVNIFGGTGVVSNAAETALENIVPDELKVEIVSAINAKQIKVVFSQPVQAGTAAGGAEVKTNYVFDTINPDRIELNEAKTEAVLTFAAGFVADLNKYVNFEVKNIKTADGKTTIEAYKAPLFVEDKVAPTATAKYKAPVITITFSEPMQLNTAKTELATTPTANATVAVDGVPTTIYTVVEDNDASDALTGAKAIKLNVTTLGLSEGKHTVSIVGARDLVGNFLPDFSTEVTVAADTTAPKLVSLTAEGNMIRIKFDEPLVDVTFTDTSSTTARVWLTDGTIDVFAIAADAVDDEGTEYLVDASAFVTGTATWRNVPVTVKAGSSDASGNAITDQPVKNLIITLDKTAPKVVSVQVKDDKLIVKFDEAIQAGTTPLTAAGATDLVYKFVDKDGVVHSASDGSYSSVAYVYDANNNGVTTDPGEDHYLVITLNDTTFVETGQLKAGKYEITLPAGAVKDKATPANDTEVDIKLTFEVEGVAEVTESLGCTPSEVAPGKLQFSFTAPLTNAALDRNNFTINGAALPEGTNLYFYSNKQTVIAELPAGAIAVTGNRTVAVRNIVDEDGNTLTKAAKDGVIIALTENVKPVAESAALLDDQTIAVEMSEAIADPSSGVTGVEVYVNGVKIDTTTNALTFARAAGKKGANTQLTITAANTDTFAPTQTIIVKFVEGSTLADTNGNTVAAGSVTVTHAQ
jgi:putative cell wall-binding protein